MNTYELKQEARKKRYEAQAHSAQAEADARYKCGHDALSAIPFGQPILVGHYSERGDRAYRSRAIGNIEKSFEIEKKADYYAQRAESVGTGGISSDDPDAVKKLREKLAKLEDAHAGYKAHNVKARKEGGEQLPAYVLSNSNANINSVKKRIQQLEAHASMEVREDVVRDGFVIHEDKEENRIMFLFDGKPDASTRTCLKRHGFKWSPTRSAWVRQLNNAGRYAASFALGDLTPVPCEKCGGKRDVEAIICSKCSI